MAAMLLIMLSNWMQEIIDKVQNQNNILKKPHLQYTKMFKKCYHKSKLSPLRCVCGGGTCMEGGGGGGGNVYDMNKAI